MLKYFFLNSKKLFDLQIALITDAQILPLCKNIYVLQSQKITI